MAEESTKQTGESEIITTGELSCLLVFSEQRHVNYIYPLLSILEGVLKSRGFNPRRLGDDIRSGQDYMAKLQEMAEESVLGVVVFDGFRPNVLFEFGFLKGLSKPVILIQDKGATISVRTFYKNCVEAGLTQKTFDTILKNPCINLPEHFSDFAGKHIAYVNWNAKETDATHPEHVLKGELEKNQKAIADETKRVKTKGLALAPAEMERVLPHVVEIVALYTAKEDFSLQQLQSAYDGMLALSQQIGFQIPPDLYSMVAASYVKKSEKLKWNDVEGKVNCLQNAAKVYEEVVDITGPAGDKAWLAKTKRAIGKVYYVLAELRDRPENLAKAIAAYLQALEVYSLKTYPDDFAATQNNLGNAYRLLAEVMDKAANCKKSVHAFEQALKVYTLDQFPIYYAMTQNNLGNGYQILAEVKDKSLNCKRAIKAYQGAAKVYTLKQHPNNYAFVQNNLGNTYRTLGEVKNKAANCNKAIQACQEALRVITFDHLPIQYAMTQNNLGNAYRLLAEVRDKAANCKKSVRACQKALKFYTLDRFPMDFAMTQNNLGTAYITLAEVKDKAANCKKSVHAFQQASKVYTFDHLPIQYATTQNNLGNAYCILAEVEDKANNCKKAILASQEALNVYTLDQFPMDYAMTQNNLGAAYQTLAEVEDKVENCRMAQTAYGDALKVYTKKEFPDLYCLVVRNLDRLRAFCEDIH